MDKVKESLEKLLVHLKEMRTIDSNGFWWGCKGIRRVYEEKWGKISWSNKYALED